MLVCSYTGIQWSTYVCALILLNIIPVRPEFSETLAIKQSKHPILERISTEPPVPNNIVSFV